MSMPRGIIIVALALLATGLANPSKAAEPPKLAKPRPAAPAAENSVPLPAAAIDQTLDVNGETVKARQIDTRLSIDVRVNGHGPYPFIVDSGADTSVVSTDIARDLQLPLGTPATLNGMTSRDVVDRVKVDTLSFGQITLSNLELPALRETDVGAAGILGIDALSQKRLLMDFEKRIIRIEDGRTHYVPLPGEIVVTGRRQRGQLILTHVAAAGLRVDAVIDTGTEITIGNLALRDRLLKGNRDKFITVEVTGVTGTKMNVQVARIGQLELGPITLNDVPMAFADAPPFKLFGLSDQPALLLGTDLLETFRRLSLDFHARKVRFQLRHCNPQGVIISTDPDNSSRLSSNGNLDVCER